MTNIFILDPDPPRLLYRYFATDERARAFSTGRIYLSTLQNCRNHEDAERADPGEASSGYISGTLSGDSDTDPRLLNRLRRSGIQVTHFSGEISNNLSYQQIPDAYLLCLSTVNSPELCERFGDYVVQVRDSRRLFCAIIDTMERLGYLGSVEIGCVRYGHRDGVEDDPEIGPIGFVKPEWPYAIEREVRLMWRPAGTEPIAPMEIDASKSENWAGCID